MAISAMTAVLLALTCSLAYCHNVTTHHTSTNNSNSNHSSPSRLDDEGIQEPIAPSRLGMLTDDELDLIKARCAKDRCMQQTEETLARRSYVKQLWVEILQQQQSYNANPEMAANRAEQIMQRSKTAKYVLMRQFGFPAKLAMPTDDGIFEGDVLLPEIVTDEIIRSGLSISSELRSDAELQSMVNADDKALLNGGTNRSAIHVDRLRTMAWSSSVFYHIDPHIDSYRSAVIVDALNEVANASTGCVSFVARTMISENDLADTIVFRKMPKSIASSISSCTLSSLGKLPFNFVYINFGCTSASTSINLKGEVLHGVMHALGVVHEHNRIDRNEHLVVQWSKVLRDSLGLFVLDRAQFVSTFGTPFDFSSVMMYSPSVGVASADHQSLVPKDASEVHSAIGQRERLSCADADMLRRMFCCSQGGCSDRGNGLCGYFATRGECSSKRSWSWMRSNCARSCRQCCKLGCAPSDCGNYCQNTRSLCPGPLCQHV